MTMKEGLDMAGDVMSVIDRLRQEAIERCKKRILEASQKHDGKKAVKMSRQREYGMTSALKRQHGL
jgi:hypothetical protein